MSTDIPKQIEKEIREGANDNDCVLLTNDKSYRGQLVRLAAYERGLKYQDFNIDIFWKMTQAEPWYMTLNPKGYVPTMLVGNNNNVTLESANII